MADLPWDYQLRPGQRANPAIYHTTVDLGPDVLFPTDAQLGYIFKTEGYKLQTWGRTVDAAGKVVRMMDPHWIATSRATPLHSDPAYPRYSHHLKIRVDPGIVVRGLDKVELPLARGTFYILDTHSPHQVLYKGFKRGWNVACSIDNAVPLNPETAIRMCLEYIRTQPFNPPFHPDTGFNVRRNRGRVPLAIRPDDGRVRASG